jgi:membrane protein DedA with SNARE-associated domain
MVIAAGATRYNFWKFVIADGLAALVSGGMFIAIGMWAGKKFKDKSISQVRAEIKPYEHWIMLGIAVIAGLVVVYIIWRKRKHHTLSDVALEKAEHHVERHPSKDGSTM